MVVKWRSEILSVFQVQARNFGPAVPFPSCHAAGVLGTASAPSPAGPGCWAVPTPDPLHPTPNLPVHLMSPPKRSGSEGVTALGLHLSPARRVLGLFTWQQNPHTGLLLLF